MTKCILPYRALAIAALRVGCDARAASSPFDALRPLDAARGPNPASPADGAAGVETLAIAISFGSARTE